MMRYGLACRRPGHCNAPQTPALAAQRSPPLATLPRRCPQRSPSSPPALQAGTIKTVMSAPLPRHFEQTAAGAGGATTGGAIGGDAFAPDTLTRAMQAAGHKLQNEVLAPLHKWQEVFCQLEVSRYCWQVVGNGRGDKRANVAAGQGGAALRVDRTTSAPATAQLALPRCRPTTETWSLCAWRSIPAAAPSLNWRRRGRGPAGPPAGLLLRRCGCTGVGKAASQWCRPACRPAGWTRCALSWGAAAMSRWRRRCRRRCGGCSTRRGSLQVRCCCCCCWKCC